MLLIFPPAAKPCELPAGIAKLAAALSAHGIPCTLLDANLEGMLSLLQQQRSASDTWTRRAIKNINSNVAALRDPSTYLSPDRYGRAVRDVNRALEASAKEHHAILGLADYHHQVLSPVRSADLISSANHPEQNPFYPYFKKRLPEVFEKKFSPRGREEREENPETGHAHAESTGPVAGFSLNYLSQALCTFAMIGYLKKEFPNVKVILGGGLMSSWMKRPGWKDPFGGLVDHLIAGPGELPLLDLFGVNPATCNPPAPAGGSRVVRGRSRYLREPPASAGGGSTEAKQVYSAADYGSLPLQEYLSPGFILPYSGSSGCYWNKCSFCPETAEDNPYLPVPTEQAMHDLASLIAETKPKLIHLLDNSVSPALMRAIADKPLGVPWYGFARIGRELLDLDLCRALKRSGCVMLKLGLESGDQGVLDRMRKGIDLGEASQVLKNLQRAGIATYVYLLFGTPAETINEARKTLEFVVAHTEAITFLNLAVFNMPICGQEAGEYETEQFYEGDLSLYTGFKHPEGWDRKAVRLFLENEFKKHPAISKILKNDPPLFTSNHAAFFCSGMDAHNSKKGISPQRSQRKT